MLSCTIIGSFRFKREIDLTREELEDNGVKVLAPERGRVIIPRKTLFKPKEQIFRPLSQERGMSIKTVEDKFLRDIARSDFVYVVAVDGYTGTSASMEIGFVLGVGKRIFSSERIYLPSDTTVDRRRLIEENVKIGSVIEALGEMRDVLE